MKIAVFLGYHYKHGVGGAEIQTSFLIDQFLKKGHKVYYFCYDNNELENGEHKEGEEVIKIKRPPYGIKSLVYLHKRSIYKEIDRIRPDVIYQRGDYHFSDIISAYGHKRGIPVVTGISMKRHCEDEKIKINHMILFQIIDKALKRRYYRRSTVIVSQSDEQKRMLKDNLGFDSVIIPNGHPVIHSEREKDDPPMVVWVANVKPIKQPSKFVELARNLDDLNVKFIMIGRPASGEFQRNLERDISEVGNLTYLGGLPYRKTLEYISRASLLVNTSESEGFSNTFIQAWMTGTPVISLNSDPDDVIKSNGIGCHCGSSDQMHEDVRKLLMKRDLIEEMGSKSREFALETYDIEGIAGDYLYLFGSLLETK